MMKPNRKCPVCNDPRRPEIDRQLLSRHSIEAVATNFSLPLAPLEIHRRRHLRKPARQLLLERLDKQYRGLEAKLGHFRGALGHETDPAAILALLDRLPGLSAQIHQNLRLQASLLGLPGGKKASVKVVFEGEGPTPAEGRRRGGTKPARTRAAHPGRAKE